MAEYESRGALEILRYLEYDPKRLDLAGRIFSLEDETDLIRFVEIDGFGCLPPSLELYGKWQPIYFNVALQPYSHTDTMHDEIQRKIACALQKHGMDPTLLFSYCAHSYGIEYPGKAKQPEITVHFNSNLRTDKHLHPRDRLHTLTT